MAATQFAALLRLLDRQPQDAYALADVQHALAALSACRSFAPDEDTPQVDVIPDTAKNPHWNAGMSAKFMALRLRHEHPAVLLARVAFAMCAATAMDAAHPLADPLRMAIALGGAISGLPFHSHHHVREVACLAVLLGLAQHRVAPFADETTALAELFIAACVHDFAHDGQGNRRHDKHTPMRLERRAIDKSEPYMKAAGIPDASWRRITAMVLATDVSKGSSDGVSPAEWLRAAVAGKSSGGCPDALLPLFADRETATLAALLEDADLGTSAGMPYDHARRMTALIADETKVLSPTPQTLIGFIEHICHDSYITPAANAVFGDNMKTIREMAARENADTIYFWS